MHDEAAPFYVEMVDQTTRVRDLFYVDVILPQPLRRVQGTFLLCQ